MNVYCSTNPCPILLNAACVFYQGANLIYTGINTNDNLQIALEKIDARFSSVIGTLNVTSPLQKTGTVNVVLSIPQATSLVDGYLDSSDWSVFNSKQNAITLTTTGSSGASTFISSTLNIPNYSLSGLGGNLQAVTDIGSVTTNVITAAGFTLPAQPIGLSTYRIGQVMATDDSWAIYGYADAVDNGDLFFELQDNAALINGQRFRFRYGNISSGTPKDILLMNYDGATIDGTLQVNNLAGIGTRMVVANSVGLLSTAAYPTSVNIYNSDGTLTGNREVSLGGNYLQYGGASVDLRAKATSATGAATMIFYSNTWPYGFKIGMYSNTFGSGMNDKASIHMMQKDLYFTQSGSAQPSSADITMAMFQGTKNVSIGSVSDAGYKLDINGTARVSGNLTTGNGTGYGHVGQVVYSTSSASNSYFEASSASGAYASLTFTKAGVLSTMWQVGSNDGNNFYIFRNGVNKEIFKIFESTKNVGIDEVSVGSTFTDVVSAKLFVNSTTKGFLPPRMTTTQKNAIASPVAGLTVYDNTTNVPNYYNGAAWVGLGTGTVTSIATSGPITGGTITTSGTIGITQSSASSDGYLSSTDWSLFNGKIGGTGSVGQVAYWNGTSTQTGSNNLFWDSANNRLGIGTTTPTAPLDFGSGTGSAGSISKIALYASPYGNYGFGVSPNQLDYVSANSHVFYNNSPSLVELLRIDSVGNITSLSLVGSGTRMVVASSTGVLSTQAIPTGTVTSIATSGPITGGTITSSGTIGITQATTSTDGYLSSTNWNTFNDKQPQLNGTGFVKASGTTISYDNSTYYLASNPSGFLNYNIYTSDGTLSANRTITTNGNSITFTGGGSFGTNIGIGGTPNAINSLQIDVPNQWSGAFIGNMGGNRTPSHAYGIHLGWNYTGGSAEANILWGTQGAGGGGNPYLTFSSWDGTTKVDRMVLSDVGKLTLSSYLSSSSFPGTPVGYLAFDLSGNVLTVASPTSTNIYNSNGTLTGDRTISTTTGFKLTFNPNVEVITTTYNVISTIPGWSSVSGYAQTTIPASTSFSATGYGFSSLIGNNYMTYQGSATFAADTLTGSVLGINNIAFTAATSTITMTQGGSIRTYSGGLFQNTTSGAVNGTITHLSGIAVRPLYRASGSSTITVTNNYGLLINNQNEYSHATITNRWGVYQEGALDNNYFAGKTIIGPSNTVGGATSFKVTGLPTSSAGLSTGDVWNNGGVLTIV